MKLSFALLALGIATSAAPAQPAPRAPRAPAIPAPADSLVVSYLTIGQGEELFDRYGHAAIRIRDARTGLDSAWNWGMYDFDSPNFIPRFLSGDTQYWMAGFPTPLFVDYYRRAGRAVWEQELALTRAESDSLLALLRWNALAANKFYRYDYYLDNCSTRVRDAFDRVLGGALRRAINGPGHDITWRDETLRLAAEFPLVGFGMTFALGKRADEKLTAWDEAFIPMRLRDEMRSVVIARAGGATRLVSAERALVPEGRFVEASSASASGLSWALLVGFVLAVIIELLGHRTRRSAAARWGLAAIGTAFAFVAGMSGLLVLCAGLFTKHVFMGANVHVLAATPATLALAAAIPAGLRAKASGRARAITAAIASFAAAVAVIGVIIHLFGAGSPKDFFPDIVIAAPTGALALALRRWARAAEVA